MRSALKEKCKNISGTFRVHLHYPDNRSTVVFVNVESKAKVLYELAFVFGNLKENYALFSTVPRKMITIDSSEYISDLIKEGHIAIEVGQQYYDPLTDFVPNQIFLNYNIIFVIV